MVATCRLAGRQCLSEHRSSDHLRSTDELAGTRWWGHSRTRCRPEPDGRPARVLPIVGCAGEWQVVNVSQKTSQLIGGPVTSCRAPDGEFIVEHLAGRSPAGDLLVFFWSPRADWQVVNVTQIAGGEPLTGAPTVYQVYDGLENVEILGARGISGSLRLYSWRPSHDWQIYNPSELIALTISVDLTSWLIPKRARAHHRG